MIYNPYNTVIQDPTMNAQQTLVQQAGYPNYGQQQVVTQTTQSTCGQPVMQPVAYPVYGQAPVTPVAYPMVQQPVMAPGCQTPVPQACGVATPVMVQQPVNQIQQVQQVQATQPAQQTGQQVATTQTTAHQKKTSYVEAYLQPVDSNVPLMQPTVDKSKYPISADLTYVNQQPVKSSTQQDYNLYLMENEYYANNQAVLAQPARNSEVFDTTQNRADNKGMTCENLPLATAYVKSQPYNGVNTPAETLQQGTAFSSLYSPYTPQKVSTPSVYIFQGGQR